MSDKAIWTDEPDKLEFVYRGLQCQVRRHSRLKHLCGYVGVGKDHPAFGKNYQELDDSIDVHRGLTFSCDILPGDMRQSAGPWWFGFDCAHAGDFIPIAPVQPDSHLCVYRTMEYVRRECEKLAEQLADLGMTNGR